MAIMSKMRDLTKVILYILVVAFVGTIIFNWGMNYSGQQAAPNAVGEVEGVEISVRDFDRAYAAQMDQYRQRAGGEIPESQKTFVRNQVWESVVRDVLLQKTIEEKSISAADQEIIYRLYNAPPEILKSNPSFQDENKQFDMAKYQTALNDPNAGSQWQPVEEYLRQTLPYEKLQQNLEASVRTTEDEIKREFLKTNQNTKVKYIFVDPRRYADDSFDISDAMVSSYYGQHKDEFKQEEERAIEYVMFPAVATAEDSAEQRKLAQRILGRAQDGEDFNELAQVYSEDDATKDKGGDVGYFAEGDMFRFKEFEKELFQANVGEIVGPVQSELGLHLLKVTDTRKEKGKKEIQASHILFKFGPSRKTEDTARDNADYVVEEGRNRPMVEVVAELGDSVNVTGLFVKGSGFIPGIGLNQRASNFIFSRNVDEYGPVDQTPRGFLAYRISSIEDEHTKPLEEVKAVIRTKLVAQERMKKAGDLAKQIHDKVSNGSSFEAAAQGDSLEAKETAQFTRDGSVAGVGRDTKFIGAAFGLANANDVSAPVAGTRGYYLLQLTEKSPFDSTAYVAQRQSIAAQLQQRKKSLAFANWYAGLKAKADIKDYRDKFYY